MAFQNKPRIANDNGETTVKRYVHQPLTIDHNGIKASILKTGKVVISKVASTDGEVVEFDEVEIPASLIFKLGNLLRATRNIEYVKISDLQAGETVADSTDGE